jgi:hypothetical protein
MWFLISINLDSLQSVDTLRIYGPGSYWTDSGLSLELSLPQLGSATELRIQARVLRFVYLWLVKNTDFCHVAY